MEVSGLSQDLFYSMMIALGLIGGEFAISNKVGIISALAPILFLLGWYLYLRDLPGNLFYHGAAIPIIALLGQVWFGHILSQSPAYRRNWIMVTMIFWVVFMAVWMNYLMRFRQTQGIMAGNYAIAGMLVLMIGMMGYFFIRSNDWNALTGGLVPKLNLGGEIDYLFNPFTMMVGFAWALMGMAKHM